MKAGIVEQQQNAVILKMNIPFLGAQDFLILTNKDRGDNISAPTFKALMSAGSGHIEAGAIFDKVSEKGTAYKSMVMENPFFNGGKANFALFSASDEDKAKNPNIIYNVIYSAPKKVDNTAQNMTQHENRPQQQNVGYSQPNTNYNQPQKTNPQQQSSFPEIDINDDEIPF